MSIGDLIPNGSIVHGRSSCLPLRQALVER